MNRAFKVVLLLVLLVVVVYAGRRIADGITFSHRCSGPEAQRGAERVTVEAAIEALMAAESITDLSKYSDNTPTGSPVWTYDAGEATNDMSIFPSAVWHTYYDGRTGYSRVPTTKYFYTVEVHGTVRQFSDAAKTVEYPAYTVPELPPEDRRASEKVVVQQGVERLMEREGLTDLSLYADGTPTGSPVRTFASGEATNDMAVFPSQAWHLYRELDEGATPLTMIFRQRTMECYYTVELDGTVRQFADAAKTVEYGSAE